MWIFVWFFWWARTGSFSDEICWWCQKRVCRVTWKPAAVCKAAFAYQCICIWVQYAFIPAEAAKNLPLNSPQSLVYHCQSTPLKNEKSIFFALSSRHLVCLLNQSGQSVLGSGHSIQVQKHVFQGKLVSKIQVIPKLHHSFLHFQIGRSEQCCACKS